MTWDQVTPDDVVRAIQECDRLGPEHFFAQHGFAPTTNYELVWAEHRYPPSPPGLNTGPLRLSTREPDPR